MSYRCCKTCFYFVYKMQGQHEHEPLKLTNRKLWFWLWCDFINLLDFSKILKLCSHQLAPFSFLVFKNHQFKRLSSTQRELIRITHSFKVLYAPLTNILRRFISHKKFRERKIFCCRLESTKIKKLKILKSWENLFNWMLDKI